VKKVKDIMEPIIDTVSPDTTVKEAIMQMRVATRKPGVYGVKGILVLDTDGRVTGMLAVKDILSSILPKYMLKQTEVETFSWPGMLEHMANKVSEKTVGEIMSTDITTVSPEATLMECAVLVLKHNLWRLPVVNPDNRPVGMLYLRDLHYAIADAILGTETDK